MARGINLTAPQREFWHLPAKYPLFCGGYGSGKTEMLVARAITDLQSHPGMNVAIYEPTYDLHRLIVIPRIEQIFAQSHAPRNWGFHGAAWMFWVRGLGRIFLRSLSNPGRIVGYETGRAHVDEIDILPKDRATEAWNRIIARNRQRVPGLVNTVSAYGTPEGYKFTYARWGRDRVEGYGYVRAPTETNQENLPSDYIASLRNSYPAQLVDAYLDGIWTNLTSGTVYRTFDRKRNDCNAEMRAREPLHIGQDFNVGAMASTVHVIRDGKAFAVDEITREFDTPSMLKTVAELYSGHPITFYPDASGRARKTSGASKTDLALIRAAGYAIKAPRENPPVRDRVLSMNANFLNGKGETRYWVNTQRCPVYTESLEQQVYDDNGAPKKTNEPDDPSHINDAGGYFIHNRFPVRRRAFTQTDLGGF